MGGQQHGMVTLDEARRRRPAGAAVERHPLGRCGRRPRRRARRAAGVGRGDRRRPRRRHHGDEAALARPERAGEPRPGPQLRAPPRLADRPDPRRRRRLRRLDDRPRRRLRHRLLVGPHRGVPRGPPRPRHRRQHRRAPGRGPARGGRAHDLRARRRPRHRRQHGSRPRPRAARRRRRRLARHERGRPSPATTARCATPPARSPRSRTRPAATSRSSARSTRPGCSRAGAAMLGTDLAGLDALAMAAPAGAGGLSLLPYLDGERTPNLPDRHRHALRHHPGQRDPREPRPRRRRGDAPQPRRRAGLAAPRGRPGPPGAHHRRRRRSPHRCVPSRRTCSASPSPSRPPAEYVGIGAARQAAWVLAGADAPLPSWSLGLEAELEPTDLAAGEEAKARYAALLERLHHS